MTICLTSHFRGLCQFETLSSLTATSYITGISCHLIESPESQSDNPMCSTDPDSLTLIGKSASGETWGSSCQLEVGGIRALNHCKSEQGPRKSDEETCSRISAVYVQTHLQPRTPGLQRRPCCRGASEANLWPISQEGGKGGLPMTNPFAAADGEGGGGGVLPMEWKDPRPSRSRGGVTTLNRQGQEGPSVRQRGGASLHAASMHAVSKAARKVRQAA